MSDLLTFVQASLSIYTRLIMSTSCCLLSTSREGAGATKRCLRCDRCARLFLFP